VTRVLTIAALLLVAAGGAPAPAVGQTNGEKLDITAFAVNMSNMGPAGAQTVEITIDSWSTAAERTRLITTMIEKGQDQLLKDLQKTPVHGRIRFPNWRGPDPHNARLGNNLHYTWQIPGEDGGRRVVIATDRYIGFWEARDAPRTIDYPFTLIELRLNKDGEGEGKMAVATKIAFDKKKNAVELENYASEPVRLNNVKAKVRKSS
jgi:hypothetical protein